MNFVILISICKYGAVEVDLDMSSRIMKLWIQDSLGSLSFSDLATIGHHATCKSVAYERHCAPCENICLLGFNFSSKTSLVRRDISD